MLQCFGLGEQVQKNHIESNFGSMARILFYLDEALGLLIFEKDSFVYEYSLGIWKRSVMDSQDTCQCLS